MQVKQRYTGTTGTQQKIKFICRKDHFFDLEPVVQNSTLMEKAWRNISEIRVTSISATLFPECFKLYNGLRARAGMLKNVMGKTGLGQSNLLIKQETHPGIDGTLQGAAVSDLLWENSSVLGMCSHAKVSWRVFELIPSYSSLSSLHFPRLWSTQWCHFKKYALSFLFYTYRGLDSFAHLPLYLWFYRITLVKKWTFQFIKYSSIYMRQILCILACKYINYVSLNYSSFFFNSFFFQRTTGLANRLICTDYCIMWWCTYSKHRWEHTEYKL